MRLVKYTCQRLVAVFAIGIGLLSTSANSQEIVSNETSAIRYETSQLSLNETRTENKGKWKKKKKTTKAKKSTNQYDSCHTCNRIVPEPNIIVVDYLIVGAGPAGLSTAADLSKALKKSNSTKTIAVVEKESSYGGQIKSFDLVEPAGYDGPPLRADVGASRMQLSTLVNTRRLFHEYGVNAYCSIFNNRQVSRGRSKYCKQNNQCQIFGSFCIDDPIFVDGKQTAEEPYGAAFANIPAPSRNAGAGTVAAKYLYGYSNKNPVTGKRCNNSSPDQQYQCPAKACKAATDYKSFLANHLHPEYSELLKHANAGFFGDFENSINACRHLEWIKREAYTLSYACYAVGGMQTLPDRMVQRIRRHGNVDFYFDQSALCIDWIADKKHYQVITPDYTFFVRDFLFLTTSNTEFTDGNIEGNVIQAIAGTPEGQSAKSIGVATVMMQWDPNRPAWFLEVLDTAGGTYSLRAYGDLDCFSRVEIVDTPYHRQHNAIKVVYSDHHCREMWKQLIEEAERTGNTDRLRDRALEGLHHLFPDFTIPPPVKTLGAYWKTGWHFTEPTSIMETDAIVDFAADPFATDDRYDNICLVGEAWQPRYSSWMESALLSSKECLQRRFEGVLGKELDKIFSKRGGIVDDYVDYDPKFGAYPGETTPGQAFPILSNEHFPPFNCLYNSTDGSLLQALGEGDACTGPICDGQGIVSKLPREV
eukprot:CAMPEP_0194310352 /NCGR_PEP_ID=MMETSP0171-20130528/7304_1 /TAXON_ID=218684 /ORGANISM="Corethron pennatum, Strain L29A3" /LENGTH=702 /DNA_ID=CAMNT_0039063949 /DNA_START=192 /DNA_END=2300 /DNA_ORIENTATION=-